MSVYMLRHNKAEASYVYYYLFINRDVIWEEGVPK